MPVIQRYRREEGFHYKMWYHGRDKAFDESVIQLSTGRIGYAESSDGLRFHRVPGQGALNSVISQNDDWYWFDTSHVGVGSVNLSATDIVKTEGGVHFM